MMCVPTLTPLLFTTLPCRCCKLSPPDDDVLLINTPYSCILKTFDRFGNECKLGGLSLTHRLQVVKQGVHDQTTLVPSNHSCDWNDNNDGTYNIDMTFVISCAVKLFVNMDKNLPGGGGELPPIHLHFKQKNEKLLTATGDIMAGLAALRPQKDSLLTAAAEVFAQGAPSFAFDKDTAADIAPKKVAWMTSQELKEQVHAPLAEAAELRKQADNIFQSFELRLGQAILAKVNTMNSYQELLRQWDQK